jgi:hypothetical protein
MSGFRRKREESPKTYGSNGLADGGLGEVGLTSGLDVLGEEAELDVLDGVEALVLLVEGVDEVLDLGHGELTEGGRRVSEGRERKEEQRGRTGHGEDQREGRSRYGKSDRSEQRRREHGRC